MIPRSCNTPKLSATRDFQFPPKRSNDPYDVLAASLCPCLFGRSIATWETMTNSPRVFLGANAVPRELQPAVHMWSPFGAISPKSHVKWSDHLKFQSTNSKQELSIRIDGSWGRGFSERKGSSLLSIYSQRFGDMLKCLKKSLGLRESVGQEDVSHDW